MSKTIAVIAGDGIGPEIMTATLRVLDALDCDLDYDFVDAGMVALEKHGDLLPASTLEIIGKHKVALKGPLKILERSVAQSRTVTKQDAKSLATMLSH